jgi:hypothetical protein
MDIPPWINGNEAVRPAILREGNFMQKGFLLVAEKLFSVFAKKIIP